MNKDILENLEHETGISKKNIPLDLGYMKLIQRDKNLITSENIKQESFNKIKISAISFEGEEKMIPTNFISLIYSPKSFLK